MSPRTHINIPKRGTNLHDFPKNMLYAELLSNIMTKVNFLLSTSNTLGKKLCIKVQLIFYSFIPMKYFSSVPL
jgi:hypothetical protein